MTDDLIPLPRDDSIPGTLVEFTADHSDEKSCAELLRRWKYGKTGFCCPRCGHRTAWFLPSRRLDECRECHQRVSLTAGTRRSPPYYSEILGRPDGETPLPAAA